MVGTFRDEDHSLEFQAAGNISDVELPSGLNAMVENEDTDGAETVKLYDYLGREAVACIGYESPGNDFGRELLLFCNTGEISYESSSGKSSALNDFLAQLIGLDDKPEDLTLVIQINE